MRNVKRTVDAAGWRHMLLQLEIARAGIEFGARAQFEPAIADTGRLADVELANSELTLTIETTSLSRSDVDRQRERFEGRLRTTLDNIARTHNVAMDVIVTGHPDPAAVEAWVGAIESSSPFVARTGIRLTRSSSWARAVVTRATNADPSPAPGVTRFVGALHVRDAWYRVQDALRDKARQMAGATGAWIRIDLLDGLFTFTEWARAPMDERVAIMAESVRASLYEDDHIDGVIVSSGAGVNLDSPTDSVLNQSASAGHATIMRRLVAPGLLRESIIVPVGERGRDAAWLWTEAYASEAQWLAHDLADQRLASLPTMWRPQTR
jgi:hypothetical protein